MLLMFDVAQTLCVTSHSHNFCCLLFIFESEEVDFYHSSLVDAAGKGQAYPPHLFHPLPFSPSLLKMLKIGTWRAVTGCLRCAWFEIQTSKNSYCRTDINSILYHQRHQKALFLHPSRRESRVLLNIRYLITFKHCRSAAMEKTSNDVGIRIYTASPPKKDPNPKPLSSPVITQVPRVQGCKRRAVAKGVQKTLSKTSMLANFLPTGTLLTFEMILPSVYKTGDCTPVTEHMLLALLGLCTVSCFFFHFTDSFKGPDEKVYYGFVTPRGLAVFKPGLEVAVPKEERYKLGFSDFVHAIMSVMVFVSIAFSDHRVTDCLFPGHVKDLEEVMESFPLMVGIVCSALFLMFPTTRHGLGCMAA